ncbi:putative lipoprotein [Hyphomonas neptunium ATCC 15444]|uniref:Putative lipoprotein n=2 Tax=Hyphomonas TaxID=85 RepID=Q0C2N6_HYPNA|nr:MULTISPECIES: META domain-containing protein [Hyphomonas]ABI77897.1 putative lipoprotein [Hyphomonas neptunium ATCC 15444]KCZ95760.1 putative lipoprotein [Hyphomonas hirschiana VP5]
MANIKFHKGLLVPLFLMGAVPILSACQTPPSTLSPTEEAALLTISGSATYRERIAAPQGATLTVELSDTSRADAPAIPVADWSASLDQGGVPKNFTLEVNEPLDPRFTYTLRATITGPDGDLLWTTDTVHQLMAVTGDLEAGELVMVMVQPAPEPEPEPETPEVTGNEYRVSAIGGDAVTGSRPVTINFMEDGRVNGFGGCNSFGGSFKESNGKLTFGDLISTMMACLDVPAGAQESALYETLRGTVTVAPGADGKVILTGENDTKIELVSTALKPLAGTSWLVETMGGTAIVAGSEPQINFDADGKINGTTGCNQFFGGYAQNGAAIAFTGVGMTKMACMSDGVMEQETAFGAILSGNTQAKIDSLGNLVIRGEDGISFTARPLPAEGEATEGDPAVLGGGAWQVEDLNRAGIIDNTVLTLTFTEDGKVSGSTGCNSLSGTYTSTGTTLTFSPLMMTRRACVAPALNNQESKFTTALQGEMAWRITADGALELTREGGHRILLRR